MDDGVIGGFVENKCEVLSIPVLGCGALGFRGKVFAFLLARTGTCGARRYGSPS